MFKSIGIAGLGLIGGSLAIEIKKRGIAGRVVGFSRRDSTLRKAEFLGYVDECFSDFGKGIRHVDFLVITTPPEIIKKYLLLVKEHKPDMLITDAASVKEKIVNDAITVLGDKSNFVGSHPIAGNEKSGLAACEEGLFENRVVVMTPVASSSQYAVAKIKEFWELIGCNVRLLSPFEHDSILGLTSHLPHVLVYVLLAMAEQEHGKVDISDFVGTGFKDMTRIGKSNPALWTDICRLNKENMQTLLDEYQNRLTEIRELLTRGDFEKLTLLFEKARCFREKINDNEK